MWSQQADSLIALGRYVEAEQLLREALAEDPDNTPFKVQLARALLRQGKLASASSIIDAAVASAPDLAYAHVIRGHVLSESGFHSEAIKSFDVALQLDPHAPSYFVGRAYAHMSQVRRVFSVGSKLQVPRPNWGSKVNENDHLDRAKSDISKALELNPGYVGAHIARSKLALVNRSPGAAVIAARDALDLDPNNAEAHEMLGIAAENSGSYAAASEHYVAAGRADPTSDSSLKRLRKLGPGGVAIPGFALYILFRFASRAARTGAIAALVVVVLLVLLVLGRWLHRRNEREKLRASFDPAAQQVLATDAEIRRRKFRRR